MAIEKVKEYFKKFGIEDKIIECDTSSATVAEAAKALNCEEKRIAKSLSFDTISGPVLIVTAGDTRVDNQKFKEKFNEKANMIKCDQVEEKIGHAAGGVCPFSVNKNVKVYLDESLKRFDTVFPACGSSNSAIKLTLAELEKYSNFIEWINVCKEII